MSEDLIRRSDAIDAVMNTEPVFAVDSLEPYQKTKDVVEALEAIPSANRPQEWIPCSERLPDEDGQYLVWAVIGFVPDHVDDPSTYQGITIAGYYGNSHPIKWLGISVEKVIAWMPLPEPWEGADDEL